MNTVLSRYNYMVNKRKTNIKHMENILQGKDKKYAYNLDDVSNRLESEKDCLKDLLTNDFYMNQIEHERQETLKKYCI